MAKKVSTKEDQPMLRINKEREYMELLKNETETLKLELNREAREAKKGNNAFAGTDINRLQEEGARYIRKIESERRKVEELELEISKYQELILEQKSRLGGVNAAQLNNQLVQKQIRQLENRMDKNLTKFNEILAENKALRAKIDDYRRERVIFDAIYKKLEKELHEKKIEMTAIIEDSKNAYLARDKSQVELLQLQQAVEKEKLEFESEFYELGELIKSQQNMLQQIRLKQFDKAQEKLKNLSLQSAANNFSSDLTDRNVHSNDIETPMVGLTPTGNVSAWGNNPINANTINNNTTNNKNILTIEKVQNYEEMIRKIQENTGLYDIEEIIARFLEAEEQNFSLFNYVNDINSEIERLEHNISDMRGQIEKYRGQGMSTDTQRKKNLRNLEEKLIKIEKKSDEYEDRYQQAQRTINQLKNGIHSIYTRIGAVGNAASTNNTGNATATSNNISNANGNQGKVSSGANMDEILSNQGVTESNMMQYLGYIEQKTAEILQAYAVSQSMNQSSNNLNQTSEKFTELSLQLPILIPSEDAVNTSITLPLPSVDDISSSDDSEEEDERPLTRHELEKRTIKDITKKSNTN
eukprot:gene21348-27658_t